jgi:hypothetical protein
VIGAGACMHDWMQRGRVTGMIVGQSLHARVRGVPTTPEEGRIPSWLALLDV